MIDQARLDEMLAKKCLNNSERIGFLNGVHWAQEELKKQTCNTCDFSLMSCPHETNFRCICDRWEEKQNG